MHVTYEKEDTRMSAKNSAPNARARAHTQTQTQLARAHTDGRILSKPKGVGA